VARPRIRSQRSCSSIHFCLRILKLGFQSIRKITTVSPQWRHYRVKYPLGESDSGLFGGNSNLGGPVWIPADYLLVETMRSFHHFYADGLKIKCPTGSRIMVDDAGD
jgi:hypothetical protein